MLLKSKHLIIFIFINNFIFSIKFPINEKIEEFEKGEIKSINIETTEDYINYIKNYNNIISLFHVDWCGHCKQFLPILDQASSYKILNKKWIFLKINCSKYPHICTNLNIQRYPTIKIYRQKELVYTEPPRELIPLIELLNKLSSNSIIKVNSKEEFFKKYGDFSPLIEILPQFIGKEEDSDFYDCIKRLANNEFIQTFYFGITESKDNIEKIIFDYNTSNVSYIWDGNCKNAFEFLYDNKYPLLTEISTNFLQEIAEDSKILIFLITFPKNQKINNFIFSLFKRMSYNNRQYVFGYADYNKDKDIGKYFELKLNNTNEMKFIIYDFNERMYYMHNNTFNIDIKNETEILNEMYDILKNIKNLKYTSGSKIKDWINKIGFEKMSQNKQILVVGLCIFIFLGIIFLVSYLSNTNDNSEFSDDDDSEDEINDKKIKKIENKNLNKKEIEKSSTKQKVE